MVCSAQEWTNIKILSWTRNYACMFRNFVCEGTALYSYLCVYVFVCMFLCICFCVYVCARVCARARVWVCMWRRAFPDGSVAVTGISFGYAFQSSWRIDSTCTRQPHTYVHSQPHLYSRTVTHMFTHSHAYIFNICMNDSIYVWTKPCKERCVMQHQSLRHLRRESRHPSHPTVVAGAGLQMGQGCCVVAVRVQWCATVWIYGWLTR